MLSFTNILNRQDIAKSIKEHVTNFDRLDDNIDNKKGLYVYGSPGCGKTHFVEQILREIDYDIIKYDAGDVRNKNLVESLTSDHLANVNDYNTTTSNNQSVYAGYPNQFFIRN